MMQSVRGPCRRGVAFCLHRRGCRSHHRRREGHRPAIVCLEQADSMPAAD